MKLSKLILGDFLLLIVAFIWGSTFVVQKTAMEKIGPFFYTGFRFLLGSLMVFLFFFILIFFKKYSMSRPLTLNFKKSIGYGVIAGLTILGGVLFQQVGLVYTTPTKAGFLTGFYVIFTPIFALFTANKPPREIWWSVILLLIGLYYLSIQENFFLKLGDSLELMGAVFWALHIIVIALVVNQVNIFLFSAIQFLLVGFISLLIGWLIVEPISYTIIRSVEFELFYGGILSVGVAYTLQVVGQKITNPSHAAIIFSFESVIASLCSAWLLHERLTLGQYFGCGLILVGISFSNWVNINFKKEKT